MRRASCVAILPVLLLGSLAASPSTAQGRGTPPGRSGGEKGDRKVPRAVKGRTAARGQSQGTEGIIGGVDRLERPARDRERPEGRSRDVESHPARGRTRETPVENSDQTRWERVKEVLRDFVRAYVNKDSAAVMRLLSPDLVNDSSILLNALLDDYQRDENINLDIELLQYRITFATVEVEARWFRTATDMNSGSTTVNQGTIRLLFDRFHDLLVKLFQGDPFFGLNDPQWREQVQAGDPNAGGGVGVIRTAGPLSLDQEFANTNADHLSLDIDSGTTVQLYDVDTQGSPPPTVPGHDFLMHFDFCSAGFCNVFIGTDSGSDNLSPGFPSQQVLGCGLGASLEDFSDIQLPLSSSANPGFNDGPAPQTFVFAVQSEQGNYGLVEVTLTVLGVNAPPYSVSLRWVNVGTNPADTGFSGGSTCN